MSDLIAAIGSGAFGSLLGALGGLASAFIKFKTQKENNRHAHEMAKLAGDQEQNRYVAELEQIKVEGTIKTEIASEQSLQDSFNHDSNMGSLLKGRDLGTFGTAVLAVVEFIRMMMRPALTLWATVYVFKMYAETFAILGSTGNIPMDAIVAQYVLVSQSIVVLSTMAFTWWFADRSIAKKLTARVL